MSLFIEDVMKSIWDPQSKTYQAVFSEAMESDIDLLNGHIRNAIAEDVTSILVHHSRDFSITGLATAGCPHCNRNGVFMGCSMCDYLSGRIADVARMNVLKRRDPKKYEEAIRFSFEESRKATRHASLSEVVTGYDTFDEDEISNDLMIDMLVGKRVLDSKPYQYEFETRAKSVTPKRISKLREALGKRVLVKTGVEVGHEWLRNHWINKNMTDQDLIFALKQIHNVGWKMDGNVLIGIPGLTEEQSIQVYFDTVVKLDRTGMDGILCSPLARKNSTLQGYLHQTLQDSQILNEIGIVQGEHTGIPSIFTIFYAIYKVAQEYRQALKKLKMSLYTFRNYYELILQNSNYAALKPSVDLIRESLNEFALKKDISVLDSADAKLKQHHAYGDYQELISKQKAAGDIRQTIQLVGSEVSRKLWGEDTQEKSTTLLKELSDFKDENLFEQPKGEAS